jgi:hypothetical protein
MRRGSWNLAPLNECNRDLSPINSLPRSVRLVATIREVAQHPLAERHGQFGPIRPPQQMSLFDPLKRSIGSRKMNEDVPLLDKKL